MGTALVARVVATTNRPAPEYFTLHATITLYRIHVRCFADRTRSWCVLRRYSEFAELHQVLARILSSSLLPALPPKLMLNTAEDLADRYLELDAFLRALLAMPAAAAHPRLRSFLGADGASAPQSPTSQPTSPNVLAAAAAANAADNGEAIEEDDLPEPHDGPAWLLSGQWVPDEVRSRDTLEPMLKAMGTPWAARRLLRNVTITTNLEHEPGVRLHDRASSSVGEAPPTIYSLDGVSRTFVLGKREGSVRALELPHNNGVRIEVTLPDGRGTVRDTRKVLASGRELERIVELRLTSQPPLRLHRLLVRTPSSVPAIEWHTSTGASNGGYHLNAPSAAELQQRIDRQMRVRQPIPPRPQRVYRHERGTALIRVLLSFVWWLICKVIRFVRAAPGVTSLLCIVITLHVWLLVLSPHVRIQQLSVMVTAEGLHSARDPTYQSPKEEEAANGGGGGGVPLVLSHYRFDAFTLLLTLDVVVGLALLRAALSVSRSAVPTNREEPLQPQQLDFSAVEATDRRLKAEERRQAVQSC